MSRIGVFGGTFNPPHKGHVRLALSVADNLKLDKVLIVPSCIPPHKIPGDLASGSDRIDMCRMAFCGDTRFEVSSIELDRGDKSYTVDTLKELKTIYPDDELYFIIGSDMLDSFRQWYRWEEILSLSYICCASRKNGYKADFSEYTDEQRERFIYVDIEPFEISSTTIRAKIREGGDCSEFLSEKLQTYIDGKNLYDDGLKKYRSILKELLDPVRLYHSECVCESAGNLAVRYGLSPEKARLAGLMHDVTKRLPPDEQIRLIGEMTKVEKSNSKVWHQMSAPVYLKENGIIDDDEILDAIRWHTTGKAGMSLLAKIVYTADFISSDRVYPDVDTVRKLAYISLEHAMLYTSRYTINSLTEKDRPVHPATLDCYNDMLGHFEL